MYLHAHYTKGDSIRAPYSLIYLLSLISLKVPPRREFKEAQRIARRKATTTTTTTTTTTLRPCCYHTRPLEMLMPICLGKRSLGNHWSFLEEPRLPGLPWIALRRARLFKDAFIRQRASSLDKERGCRRRDRDAWGLLPLIKKDQGGSPGLSGPGFPGAPWGPPWKGPSLGASGLPWGLPWPAPREGPYKAL